LAFSICASEALVHIGRDSAASTGISRKYRAGICREPSGEYLKS
jgi:hypothetical protein